MYTYDLSIVLQESQPCKAQSIASSLSSFTSRGQHRVTRHSQGMQCMSVACLSRPKNAKLDITELERAWEWPHYCLSWLQEPCLTH